VVEADRSGRQDRRRQGKSDPLDAVSAAPGRPVRPRGRRPEGPGRHRRGDPGADGRQAQRRGERTQTINQARALVLAGPDELRARFTGTPRLRSWPGWRRCGPAAGDAGGYATRIALRELGRRVDAVLPEAREGHRLASQAEGFWPAAGDGAPAPEPLAGHFGHTRPRHTGGLLLRDPGGRICAIAVE
jgi:transposase